LRSDADFAPRALRGFTLIELIVVICVVATLMAIALDRLLRYQEFAEKTGMELNVAAINTALGLKFASDVIRGRHAAVGVRPRQNPVHLLARPPGDYLGVLDDPDISRLPRRTWYFDRMSAELVYLPGQTRYLRVGDGANRGIRFRIEYVGDPPPEDPGARVLQQPVLRPVHPYRWEIRPD